MECSKAGVKYERLFEVRSPMTEMVAFLWECTFLLRCQSTPLKPPKCDTERSGTQITVRGVKRKGRETRRTGKKDKEKTKKKEKKR